MRPYERNCRNYRVSVKFMIAALFIGLFWALMPLLGWSEYSIESSISCSVEWNKKTPLVISYNVSIFAFVFFMPLSVILYTNFKIIFIVRSSICKIENTFILFYFFHQVRKSRIKFAFTHSILQAKKQVKSEIILWMRLLVLIGK